MVDWKICIDSPQKRALDLCFGSLTEGDGFSAGVFTGGYGCLNGDNSFPGPADSWGDGWGDGRGLGGSPDEW